MKTRTYQEYLEDLESFQDTLWHTIYPRYPSISYDQWVYGEGNRETIKPKIRTVPPSEQVDIVREHYRLMEEGKIGKK